MTITIWLVTIYMSVPISSDKVQHTRGYHGSDTPSPEYEQRPAAPAGDLSFMTIISALIFLYFGFMAPYIPFEDDPVLQKYSILGFNWMARIVGIGLLIVAGLTYARIKLAEPLDFFLALLAAVGCVGAGLVWMMHGYTANGVLIGIFGLLNASAARSAWIAWRSRIGATG